MPRDLKRFYGDGHLHFITCSCYHRRPYLGSVRRRNLVLRVLEQTRLSYGFGIVGYVIMPEHIHLLVSEPQRKNLSAAMKAFKQAVSRRALARRKRDAHQIALFASPAPRSFWQPRFYDFNVFTAKKLVEKLRYIHRDPVMRGLVARPEDWRWSSYCWYVLDELGIVTIDPRPPLTPKRREESAKD